MKEWLLTARSASPIRSFFAVVFGTFLTGCASSGAVPTIRTADYVDLDRFSGKWYVIASIPTFIEKEAYNAVEIYDKPINGVVETTFEFNQGALDGEQKRYHPTGFVKPDTGNALWGMQFVWPIKAEYRVTYIDEDYQSTIIGRSKRDYVWIMARSPTIDEAEYSRLLNIVKQEGYDLTKLRRVPHNT